MSTNQTETLELVPAQAPGETMKRADLPVIWEGFTQQAENLKTTAATLTVTRLDQVAEMKLARATRLALKDLRVEVEHKRKELVADLNKQTEAINSEARKIKGVIEPLEDRLREQEEFIERETIRIEDGRRTTRAEEIRQYLTGPLSVDLGKISDEEYGKMLADAQDLAALREERTRKEKEAADAKAKAEAEERERVRVENERLKKEAEEREAAARKDREEAAERERIAKQKAAEELARVKREAEEREQKERLKAQAAAKLAADKARKELEAAQEKAREEAIAAQKAREEERAKFEAEQAAARAKAKAEREAADKENARLAGIAEAERQKAATAAREAREAREKIEREEAARKAAEAKVEADRALAEREAAMAPEKDKLLAFAKTVRNLIVPEMETENGQLAATNIESQIEKFALYVEKKAGEL